MPRPHARLGPQGLILLGLVLLCALIPTVPLRAATLPPLTPGEMPAETMILTRHGTVIAVSDELMLTGHQKALVWRLPPGVRALQLQRRCAARLPSPGEIRLAADARRCTFTYTLALRGRRLSLLWPRSIPIQHLAIYLPANIELPNWLNPTLYPGPQVTIAGTVYTRLDSYYVPQGPLRLNIEVTTSAPSPIVTAAAIALVAGGLVLAVIALRRRR